jgi:hypothetical protein
MINTCLKVPLQVNFFRWRLLLWCLYSYLIPGWMCMFSPQDSTAQLKLMLEEAIAAKKGLGPGPSARSPSSSKQTSTRTNICASQTTECSKLTLMGRSTQCAHVSRSSDWKWHSYHSFVSILRICRFIVCPVRMLLYKWTKCHAWSHDSDRNTASACLTA